MKKYLAVLPLVALVFTANLAFAKEGRGGLNIHGDVNLKVRDNVRLDEDLRIRLEDKARRIKSAVALNGTVKAKTSDSLTLTMNSWGNSKHEWDMFGEDRQWFKEHLLLNTQGEFTGEIVVKVNSDTKISKDKNEVALNQIAVGEKVMVVGKRDGESFVASHIRVIVPKGKVFGEVTAKTDASVTIKNNATGESKTVTLNPDTQVKINGEVKTAADIQVGDKGFVKYRIMAELVAKVIKLFR